MQNKKSILHICSDFPFQKLYISLFNSLEKCYDQVIYVPLKKDIKINSFFKNYNPTYRIYYSNLISTIDRFLYGRKIIKVKNDIIKKIKIKQFDLIHAHFLFSDGGVALLLKKEFNIDYVVSVRSTDINIFFKYFIHKRNFGVDILLNSKKIIFITPKYLDHLLNNYVKKKFHKIILSKTEIIPNGLNQFWLDNISEERKKLDGPIKLIYVGDLSKNKRVLRLIRAISSFKTMKLTIVGGGGADQKKVEKLCKLYDNITYLGRINDRTRLLECYRNHDIFIMLSKYETFGLSYIESLSQGLPIIYTSGQGVDGYFNYRSVGVDVKKPSKKNIKNAIDKIVDNYDIYSKNAKNQVKKFSWDEISKEFNSIYKDE